MVGGREGGEGGRGAFHLVEIFYFEEIQSPFCLYLQNGLEHLCMNKLQLLIATYYLHTS